MILFQVFNLVDKSQNSSFWAKLKLPSGTMTLSKMTQSLTTLSIMSHSIKAMSKAIPSIITLDQK
jgi:hypothetical protein